MEALWFGIPDEIDISTVKLKLYNCEYYGLYNNILKYNFKYLSINKFKSKQ